MDDKTKETIELATSALRAMALAMLGTSQQGGFENLTAANKAIENIAVSILEETGNIRNALDNEGE